MSDNLFEINENTRKRFFEGKINKIIRIWYYLNEGLGLLNQFKYLIAGILAFYYFLKTDNIWLMIWMFIISMPVLVVVGYVYTYRAKKSLEWFNVEKTTYFGKYGYILQEKQNKILTELSEELKKLNTRSSFNNSKFGGFMNDKSVTGGSFIPFCEICKGVGCSTCTP